MSIYDTRKSSQHYSKLKICYSVILLVCLALFLPNSVVLAQKQYSDATYVSNIKTVQFYRTEDQFSLPFIELGSSDKLLFSFDDLSDENPDYSYKLIHCRSDWTVSNISSSEYIEGYDSAPLRDFENSINTLVNYAHYQIEIPNDDMRPTKSGNYLLMVFENSDFEKLVVTRRFRVFERNVYIDAQIKRPIVPLLRERGQEIDFVVNHPNLTVNDAQQEIKVVLEQNGRSDNAIQGLKPVFQRDNQLDYAYDEENIFLGGKEYRRLNIQNIRFQTLEVESIYYRDDKMNFQLKPVGSRFGQRYDYSEDLNGNFAVSLERNENSDTEADYVVVHFSLLADKPLSGGNVYVFGALSDWQIRPDYKLTYNYSKRRYQASILLKQGFYNYQYVFYDEDKKQINDELFEGSSFETENDYYIFVYFYDWDADYERLVGMRRINSVQRL